MKQTKQVQLLDCTLRDGGLVNKSFFSIETARAVYAAVCRAGIDYIELGYRNSSSRAGASGYGPLQFCREEDLRAVIRGIDNPGTKISLMQDAHKSRAGDLLSAAESAADLIRVASYLDDLPAAVELVNNASAKGYETSLNIMAVSRETPAALKAALRTVRREAAADMIYLADSFGHFLIDDVRACYELFSRSKAAPKLGMHFHNSRQHAFANTLAGIQFGADLVDCTILGIGRGAGNCPTELLIDCLDSPRYRLEPLLDTASRLIAPLRQQFAWGYEIPYMLAGSRNVHPAAAIDFLHGSRSSDLVTYYRDLLTAAGDDHCET